MMKEGNRCVGFTLIELMVVVAIIVLLSGMALAGYFNFTRKEAALNDARNLMSEMRKVQSLAKDLVYPNGCNNLTSYELVTSCSDNSCKTMNIYAICSGLRVPVKTEEAVLVNNNFSKVIDVFFEAGSGNISPEGYYETSYPNSNYRASVVFEKNGLISMTEVAVTPSVSVTKSPTVSNFFATGGVISTVSGYTIHTFKTSGNFVTSEAVSVDLLVVGGGGGGGGDNGGGGGGGGVVYNSSYAITAGLHNITVGIGGDPGVTNTDLSTNGGASSFDSITAVGGGKGATGQSGLTSAAVGGSGGGGDGERPTNGALGTSGQGYAGGNGVQSSGGAGGGGGAGQAGANAVSNNGGKGGDGMAYSISGTLAYYGGGGGGGNDNSISGFASGGLGGGGASAYNTAVSGTANTGGGGGGGTYSSSAIGGKGGSGVVIIRYLNP
jgi:prepilin-type N-terminal cleavage/methylation domain-containing protein